MIDWTHDARVWMEMNICKSTNSGTRHSEKMTKHRMRKGEYKGRRKRGKQVSIEEGK